MGSKSPPNLRPRNPKPPPPDPSGHHQNSAIAPVIMTEQASFQFGDFLLIPHERLLLREDARVPLTGKAFDLLLVLVRRSGHLVSKDELFQEVWPNRFVEEVNLSVNISAVRKALRPDGAAFIQTVSKRGYRFVAPVLVFNSAIPATSMSAVSAPRHGPRPRKLAGWRLALARHTRSAPTLMLTAPISRDVTPGVSARKRA